MQFFGASFGGIVAGETEAERDFQRRVWESQRAITGEGIENPFEIFRQRGEYIDRMENGGGLEPWEYGYQEPQQTEPENWLDRFDEIYRRGTERGGIGGTVPLDPESNPGVFGIEWGSFFLRAIYVVIGIVLLGIGAAALGSQAVNNPLTRTIQQAQRFVS